MATVKDEPQDQSQTGLGPATASVSPLSPDPEQIYLQTLISATSPEVLERGVKVGLDVLEGLKGPLDAAVPLNTTQASQWLKSISELKARAKPKRTIVGVVGNTGAGKSSVISAVLDEERLLPTNCMRACTASPTEISYNDSNNSNELYRAKVEFISADDWLKELQGLYIDLLDGNVYPEMTKDMMAKASPGELVSKSNVRRVLGTTRSLKATTASNLYRQLQTHVDSKEKNTEKQIEFWPLIKIVHIYTKAAALETGACIIDLPEPQLRPTTWKPAPITHAVDDKTAKSLLGDSFRRQLKYDGTYSAVTFICSKTDDIPVTEAAESRDMEDQIADSWDKINSLQEENRSLKSKLTDLSEEKADYDESIEAIELALDQWENLNIKLSEGKTVYPPSDKKRKRTSTPKGSRKKSKSFDSDDDDDDDFQDVESISDDSDKENSQPNENRQPLTQEDIEQILASLKEEKKMPRQNKKLVEQKMTGNRKEMKANNAEKAALHGQVKAVCIKGRNEYSRQAIKHDFAMGIKELDQENAAEEDEATFDPEVDLRDFDAVARFLPGFCVSSRAFQKISGRLEKDNFNEAGFESADDTEIPQLQRDANRAFTPVIQTKMIPAYDVCTNEKGPGSYMRMKEAMVSHVERTRRTMFRDATNGVQEQLETMCKTVKQQIENSTQDLHSRLTRDYLAVLVGIDIAAFRTVPRAERLLRAEMAPLLAKTDHAFARVARGNDDVVVKTRAESESAFQVETQDNDEDAEDQENGEDAETHDNGEDAAGFVKQEPDSDSTVGGTEAASNDGGSDQRMPSPCLAYPPEQPESNDVSVEEEEEHSNSDEQSASSSSSNSSSSPNEDEDDEDPFGDDDDNEVHDDESPAPVRPCYRAPFVKDEPIY
ncbi:hypothetical protein B0H66DRAFT_591910 [Apodospora peruviana]|uniref:Dynamin N-terminal domain-containing protein n=1 Tax=Apodospora peruviana TaxID=516989 RepID=A0AAE0I6F3_9PEZI|nr:hypothetical protein B0H66DRAFT_591910 [Apodospora peruviana]